MSMPLLDARRLAFSFPIMKYGVTLVESGEGWAVWCDNLPGCCSQGATREEALANIRDAIAEYQEAKFMVREREPDVRVQHAEVTA